jgi:Arc/MetJ-type ribon-helix-helix transcriptional regulator
MVENLQRDRLMLPALDLVMKVHMDQQMSELTAALASRFGRKGRSEMVRAAVALALDFWSWRRLWQEGMTDSEASRMMVETVRSAAALAR